MNASAHGSPAKNRFEEFPELSDEWKEIIRTVADTRETYVDRSFRCLPHLPKKKTRWTGTFWSFRSSCMTNRNGACWPHGVIEKKMTFFRSAALVLFWLYCRAAAPAMIIFRLMQHQRPTYLHHHCGLSQRNFGKNKLAPGETFTSPVKLTDDGALKIQFTDANGGNHNLTGPVLHRNEGGSIAIKFDQTTLQSIPAK